MAKYSPITIEDEWFVGEDKDFEFTILKPDESDVEDITGWNLEWKVRKGPSAGSIVLSKISAAGITITDALAGVCMVHVDRNDTLTLSAGTLYHTLRRTDSAQSRVLSYGEAVLKWGATR